MSYQKHGSSEYYLKSRTRLGSASIKGLHGKGHGHGDKYPGIGKNVDFHKSDRLVAQMAFDARSKRSQTLDRVKLAEITTNLEAWLHSPNRLDFPGVDTPDARLIFSHKSKQSQAADLARAAKKKVPLEIWIKDTSHADLKGVDTKKAKSTAKPERVVRKFKVVEKGEAKKVEAQKKEKKEGRKLPTSAEIIEKARENVMEQNVKKGLPPITPELSELRESGEISKARDELMRTEATTSSQIQQYVHELNEQLEPEGFKVVPID